MFSRALLTKLNCLDFLLLKGQSRDKVRLDGFEFGNRISSCYEMK
jgi:hypothetical protein